MKLIVKNLKQVPHEVEVPNGEVTVRDLKQELERVHNIDAERLKLLFNGIVLEDSKTLDSYDIKEGYVIIMMNTKIKPKNVDQQPIVEPVPQDNQELNNKKDNEQNQSEPQNQSQNNQNSNPVQQQQPVPVQPQPVPAQPQKDYTAEINNLVEMGFDKSQAEAAIKAAQGNVNIAVEFLYNGIPQMPPQIPNIGGAGNPQSQHSNKSDIEKLASVAKVLCADDPSALEGLLVTLQQTAPEMMNLITQHEEEFRNLLAQPVTHEDVETFQELSASLGLGGLGGNGDEEEIDNDIAENPGQNDNVINITQQDQEAINRIREVGNFGEEETIQAYFACEKNEELTINFLFDRMNEDNNFHHQPQNNNQNQPGGQ